jgi:AcrR family transcriptional regulator
MSAEERKMAIVTAALPLFARKGFAKTTTKDLARAARVSEPLLYKHFPSKEALYLEIQNFSCRGIDPVVRRLSDLKPSAHTLVQLVFYLMRALIVGLPEATPEWDTRHRLMLNSLLHDGAFARLTYQNRFDCFCSKMEKSLKAAIRSGDAVDMPVTRANRARFAHHVGAWIAGVYLPSEPAMEYKATRSELLNEAMWFVLRGMGMTEKAIRHYYERADLDGALKAFDA